MIINSRVDAISRQNLNSFTQLIFVFNRINPKRIYICTRKPSVFKTHQSNLVNHKEQVEALLQIARIDRSH